MSPMSDLHAFVDGQLDASRVSSRCCGIFSATPTLRCASRIGSAQRFALRRLHRDVDPRPTPAALAITVCCATGRDAGIPDPGGRRRPC